jgi:hypothetical protein
MSLRLLYLIFRQVLGLDHCYEVGRGRRGTGRERGPVPRLGRCDGLVLNSAHERPEAADRICSSVRALRTASHASR